MTIKERLEVGDGDANGKKSLRGWENSKCSLRWEWAWNVQERTVGQCVAIAWGLKAEGLGADGREVARGDICAL